MDEFDRIISAKTRANFINEVIQRILRLGKDDKFPTRAICMVINSSSSILFSCPFGVVARAQNPKRLCF